jgi:aspartyl-tRNA(Asn)/glutamyl-tRNA(Gln) amidotransferase subunit B
MITPETRSKYELLIGIETHVQHKTKTKLFCACDNDARDREPNTLVCPVCFGMPGALPVLNGEAVKLALRLGLALNAQYADGYHTKFDRKNYFYPDSPKGYQITQFDEPIVGPGYVEVPFGDGLKRIGITRAHLEGDAGKLTHPDNADYSLGDLNRAETPLVEVVSEPDIRSAAEAKAYAQELYNIVRYADVSEANLYYGNMRFDVNVSVRKHGASEFGTRSETKNLNSFKSVEKAAEYEVDRQIELLEKGEKVVQETRGWNDAKQKTFSQRSKEDAHDYRYFPEPDLPPVVVTGEMIKEAQDSLPKLPAELRKIFRDADVHQQMSEVLIESDYAWWLLEIINKSPKDAKRVSNWMAGEIPGIYADQETKPNPDVDTLADNLIELSQLVEAGQLSSTAAKQLLEPIVESKVGDGGLKGLAEKMKLIQVSDAGALTHIVQQVIRDNPKPVEQYRAGDEKVLGFLVGQVMKASKGQANPPMVNELLRKELGN